MTLQINPDAIRQGDRLALSRALSAIENNTPESREIMRAIFPFTGHAHLVGITGSPGTGKSTLANQLVRHLRQSAQGAAAPKIAVIAVDPTSPFTGGRCSATASECVIWQAIRTSLSARWHLAARGGLSHNTAAFTTLLDGAGFEIILIETVGAGQSEVDIARLAHTVIVVEAPGLGDDIQAIKAGILEIADILVVNKSDQPGADNTARSLAMMLEMTHGGDSLHLAGKHRLREHQPSPSKTSQPPDEETPWKPPVLQVIATENVGIDDLVSAVNQHRDFLIESGLWQVKEAYRMRQDLEALVKDLLMKKWQNQVSPSRLEEALSNITQRNWTPLDAADFLLIKEGNQD